MSRSKLGRLIGTALITVIAGCASHPPASQSSSTGGGGYYQNDGPPANTHIDLANIPDAVPENVPPSARGNPTSYTALGKRYYVLKSAAGFTQTGRASWYGRQFQGQPTASGVPYNMYAMTAAHKRLPIPTWVRVTNLKNHRHVVVKINDRGPFHPGRIIDLSYVAARRLRIVREGSAPVRIRTVTPATFHPAHQSTKLTGTDDTPSPQSIAARVPLASTGARQVAVRTAKRPVGNIVSLQIGAFSNAVNARQAKERAQQLRVGPVAVLPPAANVRLYRVRVGPFTSVAKRHSARLQLADANFPVIDVNR